jgi:hypothetical protein
MKNKMLLLSISTILLFSCQDEAPIFNKWNPFVVHEIKYYKDSLDCYTALYVKARGVVHSNLYAKRGMFKIGDTINVSKK